MEETRKRHEIITAEELAKKKQRIDAENLSDYDDDILAWLSVEEIGGVGCGGDLWMLLEGEEEEKSCKPQTEKVKFIENPYSSALIFQSSSSYITINGNEESCGSSFSESDSSVMASVDIGGASVVKKMMEMEFAAEEMTRGWMDGGDQLSWNENDLARFIGEEEEEE